MLSQLYVPGRLAAPAALVGKRLWLPRLQEGSSRLCAAVFRSIGVDAEVMPPPSARSLELGSRYSSGEECYPFKVTLGDVLNILTQPGNDPSNTAFLIATGQGPCRLGQYLPYFKSVFRSLGYPEMTFVSPTFENGYADFGEASGVVVRSGWRAVVCADILLKLLLRLRPYELTPGSADAVYEDALLELCQVFGARFRSYAQQLDELRAGLLRVRERFRALPVSDERARPLIGAVGEIYCRLNTFTNEELVRRLEAAGAEVWMNDVAEWFWYTNAEEARAFARTGRKYSIADLRSRIRNHLQRADERALISRFERDFVGREEPEMEEVLNNAEPYLPAAGVDGEMVVNVGKAVYFARKGLDGVIDISPFSCMNGIVGEAVYPRISKDNQGIPIRNFYFDGTQSELDRDVGIFVELARNYRQRRIGRDVAEPGSRKRSSDFSRTAVDAYGQEHRGSCSTG